ncbi:MAG: hypothetical protein AABY07_10940 [Nanoarchaeota archaeon]
MIKQLVDKKRLKTKQYIKGVERQEILDASRARRKTINATRNIYTGVRAYKGFIEGMNLTSSFFPEGRKVVAATVAFERGYPAYIFSERYKNLANELENYYTHEKLRGTDKKTALKRVGAESTYVVGRHLASVPIARVTGNLVKVYGQNFAKAVLSRTNNVDPGLAYLLYRAPHFGAYLANREAYRFTSRQIDRERTFIKRKIYSIRKDIKNGKNKNSKL